MSRPLPHWLHVLFLFVLLVAHAGAAFLFLTDASPGTDAAWTGLSLDDAWIHMVYGRSVAHYGVPYYNVGQAEAGFTSPLWVLVAGFAHTAAPSVTAAVLIVKLAGVVAALLCSVAVFELCLQHTNGRAAGLYGGLLTGLGPIMAFAQVSGMEACLASASGLWAVFFYTKRRYGLCGLMLAVSYLTRPETLVLGFCLGAVFLCSGELKRPRRALVLDLVRLAAPVTVAAAAWATYCLAVNGHPLPNTFYVKFASHDAATSAWHVLTRIILAMPANALYSGAVIYLVGAFAAVYRKRLAMIPVLLYPWLFFLAIAASRNMPEPCGHYFYWLRYTVPALPFLFIPMALGLDTLWNFRKAPIFLGAADVPAEYGVALRIAGAILVIMTVVRTPKELGFGKSQYAWNCQNINEVQVEIGKWIRDNTPEDAAVTVIDAGAIRYFGQRKTIDMVGLNKGELAVDRERRKAIWVDCDVEVLLDLMEGEQATYLVLFPRSVRLQPLIRQEAFQNRFEPVATFRSPHYTVAARFQDTQVIYRLRGSGSGRKDGVG